MLKRKQVSNPLECIFLVIFLFLGVKPLLYAEELSRKPNIILIMADDLGAEGLACYGSSIFTTPHLDELAQKGAQFNNAYGTPLCTPSRVMIMTGQLPNQTGFENLISTERKARLPRQLKTSGNYFKEAGYKTAIAGKWQLGRFDDFPNQPLEHGFDKYCLWKWKFGNRKTSRYYGAGIWQDGKSNDGKKADYGPDAYSQYLLDFIEENQKDPFFVYFPMALVHLPFPLPPSLKELAHTKYYEGIDADTAAYGQMITYMDMLVGKIVQQVKDLGLEKETLIIFTADNGTPHEVLSRLEGMDLQGGKGTMSEAGTRVPFIAYWPGTVPAGKRDAFISLVDVLPSTASIAGFKVKDEVNGMDLSHTFLGVKGHDRDHIFVAYRGERFVRNKRFRLHDNGKLIDCSVASNQSRYSKTVDLNPEHDAERKRMQLLLDQYIAMPTRTDLDVKIRGFKKIQKK